MTIKVFVHGNPETELVWAPLITALAAKDVTDIVKISPPGFGSPIPSGFGATQNEYRNWLIHQIEKIGQPVHLLGHDWGAGHVYGVVASRPDLVVSWTADCAGLLDPDYVWHDAAQIWQKQGEGERFMTELVQKTGAEIESLFGVPNQYASILAEHFDDAMGKCILSLYRSAKQPAMKQLGDQLEQTSKSPSFPAGALIDATGDPYVSPALTPPLAERLGAQILSLQGASHWWMFDTPAEAAQLLVKFWDAAENAA